MKLILALLLIVSVTCIEAETEPKVSEIYYEGIIDKIKNLFNALHITETLSNFKAWLSKTWSKSIEDAKTNVDKLKIIAKQFIASAATLPKDVISEAVKFFDVYKEQIGDLWTEIQVVKNNSKSN